MTYNVFSGTLNPTQSINQSLIPPGNTWSLLECNWFCWKFLTDGMTTKASSHKNSSSPVVWKVVMVIGDCVYFLWLLRLLGKQNHWSQGLVLLPSNCQLKVGTVRRVNRISVISGVRVLLKCLLESVWESGNLFGCICRHPDTELA